MPSHNTHANRPAHLPTGIRISNVNAGRLRIRDENAVRVSIDLAMVQSYVFVT